MTELTRRAFLNEVADALESGEWRQARSRLREGDLYDLSGVDRPQDYDRFCCLGVACEVAVRHGLLVRNGDGYQAPGREGDRDAVTLPGSLAEWLTGYEDITDPTAPGRSMSFTTMNDDLQLPFTEIALYFRAWAENEHVDQNGDNG